MSDKDELFINALSELKTDIRQIDGKMDEMHGMLVKNSTVLEEHERRSTASERRLELLEDKYDHSEKKFEQLKGFFMYSTIVITSLAAAATFIYNILLPLLKSK